MVKRNFLFAFVLMLLLSVTVVLSSCSNNSKSTNEKNLKDKNSYVIGVTQIVEHPSLNATFKGFKKALEKNGLKEGKNVRYIVQIAQGDQSNSQTIAKNLVSKKVDIILAISTPSAQHALNATKDIPIVFSAITDPVGAGLVDSFEKPGKNITGVTDTHPDSISKTLNFMVDQIKAKKIGILYNSGEQNSVVQVGEIKKLLNKKGAKLIEAPVATSADVKQATESLIGRVDAIFIPNDNTVVSAIESVITIANDKDIPLFANDIDTLKKGAVAATGFNYEDIGYKSGLMAVKILKEGKKPSEIPVERPDKSTLMINKEAAKNQGVNISEGWSKIAEFISGK